MKKTLSIAAITLMMAGSSVFACSSCGCTPKEGDKSKTECSASKGDSACSASTAKKSDAGAKKTAK